MKEEGRGRQSSAEKRNEGLTLMLHVFGPCQIVGLSRATAH